jgi:hypothetical protein
MSNTDCSDEEDVAACYYFRRRKQKKDFRFIPYLENNIRCRLFVAASKGAPTNR